jgi:hypothetical protein
MVDRLVRRVRGWFGRGGRDSGTAADTEWAGLERKEDDSPTWPSLAPLPPPPPTPVPVLLERLSSRLVKEETVRGSLTDQEFAPLREWANRRLVALAESSSRLAPGPAEDHFNRVASRLLELLRTVDLAVGQRAGASAGLVASRFQMLDTLLVPPLLDGPTAQRAQIHLTALLAQPAAHLKSADAAELICRLVEALERP